jgi:PKD repeat protein
MPSGQKFRRIALSLTALIFLSACSLGRSTSAPDEEEITSVPTTEVEQTPVETTQALETTTPRPFQTVLPATSIFPTMSIPTQVGSVSTPTSPQQVSIFILSPVPGNIVSGSQQIIGSATHSNFLQYQLEYGPDPNPSNLWYAVSGAVQSPVANGLLGIWNTSVLNDGAYQLRLRVFLRDGTNGDTVTVNNIIVRNQAPTPIPSATPVIERPIAAFTQSATVGTAPLTVQFTNLSTGSITGLQWNFGDGTTSSEINPTHRFNNPGAYSVTLTATGPGGTSNVTRQILVQSPNPPVAAFTTDRTEGLAPLTVTFTDISSGGQISDRTWNFGDGNTTTRTDSAPISHTFQSVGTYNVILQVNGPGGFSTATRQVRVGNPIEADIRVTPDTTNSLRVILESIVSGGSGNYTNYEWDFGNGQTRTGAQTDVTYATGGTYTVQLRVRDSQGNEALVNRIIDIATPTPIPSPTVTDSPTEVAAVSSPTPTSTAELPELVADFVINHAAPTDLNVSFEGIAQGGTGTYEYNWDFGDGTTATGQAVSHAYAQAGVYNVTLTVSDGQTSVSDVDTVTIEQEQLPELVANVVINHAAPTDLNVSFEGIAQGGTGTYEYNWDFGDGTTATGQAVSHAYAQAGVYNVTLTVSDGQISVSDVDTVTIEQEQLAELVVSGLTANVNASDPYQFNFSVDVVGGTGNYSYTWSMGDGFVQASSEPIFSYRYPSQGNFNVSVTVNDGNSEQSTVTAIHITAQSITPVQPDVNPYIPEFTQIYINATSPEQENPRNPNVITVIGDQTVNNANFLAPILQQENYQLDESANHITSTIDRFATGLSQQNVPTLDDLLSPGACDPNLSQLVCLINQTNTTVVIIGVGLQDAVNPNPQDYQAKLTDVVAQAKGANAIPILVTLYPTNDPSIIEGVNAINDVIIQVGNSASVPVINVWRALHNLPENGLSGGVPSVDPNTGASYLSANSIGGANMMNYYTLETLTQILNAISQ